MREREKRRKDFAIRGMLLEMTSDLGKGRQPESYEIKAKLRYTQMHINQEGHSHKYTNRETNTKGGNSLVVQWLGHNAFTAVARVQSRVGEHVTWPEKKSFVDSI